MKKTAIDGEVPFGVALALSKHVHDTGALMHAAYGENLSFGISQTRHGAALCAKVLRALIRQATAAALAFEAAAAIKDQSP